MSAFTDLDTRRLSEAIDLAERAIGLSDPNPRVGCVIGRVGGEVLGRGHTQRVGEAHAEVMALRDAAALGHGTKGATAWVSLEPCAHQGRTPPCCDALVKAGIARVVVAMSDPFPAVSGRGVEHLRAAGVEVVMATDALSKRAHELNIGFVSRHTRGRPWLRMKSAMSLDGRSALLNGNSQWITGQDARADGHLWRRRAGAVVTGIGTVQRDNPRLDVRLQPTVVQPLRVVLDSHWRISPDARILQPPGRALVCGLAAGFGAAQRRLGQRCQLVVLPAAATQPGAGAGERRVAVDLHALLQALADREVNEIHVEAGPALSGELLRLRLVDEWVVYVAPTLIGPGLPVASLPAIDNLGQAMRWAIHETLTLRGDLVVRLRPLNTPPLESGVDHGCREV